MRTTGLPQFATAEYAGQPGETVCRSCSQRISSAYYRVNDVPTCATCAQRLRAQLPQDSHGTFGRAVLFGVGAAVLGLVLYATFALVTGLVAGIVSLAVGYLVGKAMVKGSRGIGGRRYQVAAVLLTYMAVSLSAVPIAVSQYAKHRSAERHAQLADSAATQPARARVNPARALGVLAMVGLASPFLELSNPTQGIIGLVILFVGLRIAWRTTARRPLQIVGPISPPAPTTSG